ncbi:uncharacterized protein [Halyomorpha halys]|uniref:uncharacterized protein n=1 Tax=Halyomorpha halys TaxID=286706 RepID=UPI0034D31460
MEEKRIIRKAASTRYNIYTKEAECHLNRYGSASTSAVTLKNKDLEYKYNLRSSSVDDSFEKAGIYNESDTETKKEEGLAEGFIKKPFQCKFCIRTFKRQKYLSSHMRFHTIKNEVTKIGAQKSLSAVTNAGELDSDSEIEMETNSNVDLDLNKSENKQNKSQTFKRQKYLSSHMRIHTIKNKVTKIGAQTSLSAVTNAGELDSDSEIETETNSNVDLDLNKSENKQNKSQTSTNY